MPSIESEQDLEDAEFGNADDNQTATEPVDVAPTDGPILKDGTWKPIDGRELYFHSYISDSGDDVEQRSLDAVDSNVLDLAEWIRDTKSTAAKQQEHLREIRRRLDRLAAAKSRDGAAQLIVEVGRIVVRDAHGGVSSVPTGARPERTPLLSEA